MDMLKVKGKITSKEVKDGDTWVRASFTINEHKYSSFDQEIIDNFQIGNYVEVGYAKSVDGKYNNVQTMELVDMPAGTAVTPDKPEVNWDAKDLRSARMNGCNNATTVMDILARVDPEATKEKLKEVNPIDLAKDIAKQFVKFIYEGV